MPNYKSDGTLEFKFSNIHKQIDFFLESFFQIHVVIFHGQNLLAQ